MKNIFFVLLALCLVSSPLFAKNKKKKKKTTPPKQSLFDADNGALDTDPNQRNQRKQFKKEVYVGVGKVAKTLSTALKGQSEHYVIMCLSKGPLLSIRKNGSTFIVGLQKENPHPTNVVESLDSEAEITMKSGKGWGNFWENPTISDKTNLLFSSLEKPGSIIFQMENTRTKSYNMGSIGKCEDLDYIGNTKVNGSQLYKEGHRLIKEYYDKNASTEDIAYTVAALEQHAVLKYFYKIQNIDQATLRFILDNGVFFIRLEILPRKKRSEELLVSSFNLANNLYYKDLTYCGGKDGKGKRKFKFTMDNLSIGGEAEASRYYSLSNDTFESLLKANKQETVSNK